MNDTFYKWNPAAYDHLISLLSDFRAAYVPFVEKTKESMYDGSPIAHTSERTEIMKMAMKAQVSLDIAGVDLLITPKPLASDKPDLRGLVNVAFAHEDPAYRTDRDTYSIEADKQPYERTIDLVDAAVAKLEQMKWLEMQRRRQSTYWIDRGLRAVLGFPGYLLSLVLGFDRRELSAGRARALWGMSLVADVMGIVAAGFTFDWWG